MIEKFYKVFRLILLFGTLIVASCIHKQNRENKEPGKDSSKTLGCDSLGDQAIISQCHLNDINQKIASCAAQGNLYIWENGACIKKE